MHIIFADVDDTVYPFSHELHPQLKKDISFAQEKGVEIVFCTGNAFLDNIKKLAKILNITYVVSSNGAAIFNAKTNELLSSSFLNKNECNEFLDFANKNQIMVSWWDRNKVYYNEFCSENLIEKIKQYTTNEGNISLEKTVKSSPFKFEFFGSKEQINLSVAFLKKYKVQIIRMRDKHIEVTAPKISKGFGVEWICSYLKTDIKNTAAVGDSPNDIPMFKKVNLSYAVDNACDKLKEIATNYVSSVEQNGLGEAIIDYIYRQKI